MNWPISRPGPSCRTRRTGFCGFAEIDAIPTLRALAGLEVTWSARLAGGPEAGATPVHAIWLAALRRDITQGGERAQARIASIQRLALLAGELADMEYGFLYDKAARLLSIGYNVDDRAATRATTTCWPRKRASPCSSPSPRGSCPRRAGSPSAAC
jgi:hypothetical protein